MNWRVVIILQSLLVVVQKIMHINFDSIHDLITARKRQMKRKVLDCSEYEPCLKKSKIIDIVNPRKICREKYRQILYNRYEKRSYIIVYDKRVILENMDTVPYGY